MVLITSDGDRDLVGNQIPMGDTEMGLVKEGGETVPCVPVLMLPDPYETPEKLHGSQAASTLRSDQVLGSGEFTVCLSGDLTRQVVLFLLEKKRANFLGKAPRKLHLAAAAGCWGAPPASPTAAAPAHAVPSLTSS